MDALVVLNNANARHCEAAFQTLPKQSTVGDCFVGASRLPAMTFRRILFGSLSIFLLSGSALAWAENGSDYAAESSTKLGRGLVNFLSSPLELPCTMGGEISEKGGAGAVTGLFKGLAFFLRRALVGATEAATFIIPMEATLPPVCSKKPEAKVET